MLLYYYPHNAKEAVLHQRFFRLLAEGCFPPERIIIERVTGTLRRNTQSQQWIQRDWERYLAKGKRPWPNDEKVSRCRVAGVETAGGYLRLQLDPCVSYKDHIGALSPEFGRTFGHTFTPNSLAVTTTIQTADSRLLMTLRNASADCKPEGYHISTGGFVNVQNGVPEDPVAAAQRETLEESGIRPDELINLTCLGVTYNPWMLDTNMIFAAATTLTAEEVLKRPHDDENSLLFVPFEQDSLEHWAFKAMHACIVPGIAAAILLGKRRYGQEWYDKILKILADGSRDYDDPSVRIELEQRDTTKFAAMVASHQNT